ncbi:MAG TPA: PAS domain S-box protein, partial [Candidatus Thermoplasmatota archaeon]|nr:PAS domain S-box protein [Candidatus Thermoplasmatota archaeon]
APFTLVAQALNILLSDLEYRTGEREAAHRASSSSREARFRALFEQALEGIAVLDLEGTFLEVNPEYARVLGYEPWELVGRHFSIVVAPENVAAARTIQKAIAQGVSRAEREPFELLHRNGSRVPVEFSGHLVETPNGPLLEFLTHDVTERLQEERLERTLGEIAQAANQAETIPDLAARVTHLLSQAVNPHYLVGFYETNPATGTTRFITGINYPPDLVAVVGTQLLSESDLPVTEAVRKQETVIVRDLVRDHSNADLRRLSAVHSLTALAVTPILSEERVYGTLNLATREGAPLEDRDLRLLRLAAREVSQSLARRQMHAALEKSEARYRGLYENTNALIEILDAEGHILDVNPAYTRATGYTAEELRGKHVTTRTAPGHEAHAAANVAALLRDGELRAEGTLLRRDGTSMHVIVDAVIQRDAEGRIEHILSSLIDITPLKEAEQGLREALEELQEANLAQATTLQHLRRLNAELEDFTYTVSHDLSEPLRGIETLTGFVLEDQGPHMAPEARQMLERVYQSAGRMKAMVKGMLELSRIGRQPIRREPFPPEEVALRVVDSLTDRIEETRATVEVEEMPPEIYAQRVGFEQILTNLVSNALRYTDRSDPRITIGGEAQGTGWRFFVRDNGPGVPPEYQDRIFQVFQRGPNAGQVAGSGAGLAIVRKIVQQHEGDVWVESPPGEGATFWFTLGAPRADELPEGARAAPRDGPRRSPEGTFRAPNP